MGEYIEIISQLKQKNGANFPLADVNDLRGGYIQVDTVSEMNAFLSTNKLKEGMLCYVKIVTNAIHMYQYRDGIWNPWSGGGGESGGASILIVDTLTELESDDLKIEGQLVFVKEISDIRYYTGTFWESFSRIYIQSTPPSDKGGIWIDTSDEKVFLDSNRVIQNLLQVISVLQEKMKRIEWAFGSQLDFGDFTNNHYNDYDGQTTVEPSYGTNVEEDAETLANNLANEVLTEEEPTDAASLIPNGTHLCVKSGKYSEMVANQADFLPKELLFCYDTNQLFIKHPKTLKLVQIGTGSTTPEEDEIMEQILTEVIGTGTAAKTKITGIEFADMTDKSLTYLVQVKDGKLDVHDYRLDVKNLAGNAQGTVTSGEYYKLPYFPVLVDEVGNETSPMLYINMIYTGGESDERSYNPCSHNFIELANLGKKDINLKGLYLHYTERDTHNWVTLPLYGVIKSQGTFLIRGAQCSFMDINTTYLKVKTFDMEWSKTSTYNPDELEINTDQEQHSIWNSDGLIKFSGNSSFYLSGEESSNYFKTNVMSHAAPFSSGTCIKWYIDLVGLKGSGTYAVPAEKTALATTGNNVLLMRYYNMDNVSQAIKALADRENNKDWTYINLTNINPALSIENYIPKSVLENKNIFFDKHLLKEGAPNIITCSFGANAHTTRCFNWVSKGYYDEYIWFRAESEEYVDDITHKKESFKSGDGRASTNNRNNAIYDRIRSITTDGTAFTIHKIILDFPEPAQGTTQKYYYKVGREGFWSEEKSFTMKNRNDVISNGFSFLQVTDQQGFNSEEYETWRCTAEVIKRDKVNNGYDFIINTGDATQNGNRINEWIDYFNGGNTLFSDCEQMYTVGNNDLCPEDAYKLGYGSMDIDKINPINVQYFFTFEHPNTIPVSAAGVYIPCVYSFVYGDTYFLSMNSEISESSRVTIFGDIDGGTKIYESIQAWCETDLSFYSTDEKISWKVAFCHEAPFTIIMANTIMSYAKADGLGGFTINSTIERGGSRLNTVGAYWFSQFLQDNNFKLCMCGHKHTYSNSRYIREDVTQTMKPIVYDANYIPDSGSGATYPTWFQNWTTREKNCIQLSNNNTLNYVRYIMCQATGYKLTSNKELPAQNIPWLLSYYPITTQVEDPVSNTATKQTANSAQVFPHYIVWSIGTGTEVESTSGSTTARQRIKGKTYKVSKIADGKVGLYKYNVPVLSSALTNVSANGVSPNTLNNIIIEKSL